MTHFVKVCVALFVLASCATSTALLSAAEQVGNTSAPAIDVSGNWYQAGTGQGENRISNVVRAHWTSVDEKGTLSGKISSITKDLESRQPAADMRVYLARSGEVVAEVSTNAEGVFSIANVEPGSYSIVARNGNGFTAFGLNVLPFSPDYENFFRIDSAIVPVNFEAISLDNGVTPPVGVEMLENKRNTYASTVNSIVKSEHFADAIPASSLVAHKVALTADGRMMGRVRKLDQNGNSNIVPGCEVVILAGDKEVGRAVSDALGVFEITGLEPQAYSLIASCQQGFAAVGFELVANDQTAQLDSDFGIYTSMAQYDSYSMDVGLSSPVSFGGCDTCGGGGCSGGDCGGSGGLFGGGGFGSPGLFRRLALLGLIGGGIAIAIASGDDDDGAVVGPPASPAMP